MAEKLKNSELETAKLHDAHVSAGLRPRFLLICEHASNFIPAELNDLGVDEKTKVSHAAWDLGALELAKLMMNKMGSPLVAQQVSRLVYDCNRPPSEPSAMPEKSEIFEIAGNKNLNQTQRDERTEKYYKPFNELIKSVVQNEINTKNQIIIATIHSFTRSYYGQERNTEVGILHDEDARFSDAILKAANDDEDFEFVRNEPYGPEDGVTHSLKEYALQYGLHNVMIEVRNDLLDDAIKREKMADKLAHYLLVASEKLEGK